MNVTAAPFRPPPFTLSQDPLLAAGLAGGHSQHSSPSSGGVIGGGRSSQHSSPNAGVMSSMGGLGMGMGGGVMGGPNANNNNNHNAPSSQGMMALGGYGANNTPLLHGIGGPNGGGPGKYKTELCRNWEATGACNYRGCTYAHGYEDLRGGGGNGMMPMQMPPPQSMGTPQQHTYSFNNNVVNAGAGGGIGSNSGRSSAMGTPVAGTYRIGGGLSGMGGAPMGVGAGLGGGLGSTSPAPAAPAPTVNNISPQPINTTQPASHADQLIELITLEMRAEKEKLMYHQSNNRELEQQLKREQLLRQRNVNNTTVVENVIAMVEDAIRKRHAALTDIKRALGEDTMEAAVDAMLDGDGY